MKTLERFSAEVIEHLQAAIEDAEGREVLCAGVCSSEGVVTEIIIGARGDDSSVPALLPYIEKGDVVIHNHPSGGLSPSEADLAVASYLGNQGIGFYIVDNQVHNLYVVAEPVQSAEITPLDADELSSCLGPQSRLSRELSYEYRQSQIDMLKMVTGAFNDKLFCLCEAGTGVGKSFAYLLPAFQWASQNGERVIISTGTINLQNQLIDKDIPLVKRLLDSTVKAVLVKGRGNYLCFQRLDDAMREQELFTDESDALKAIEEWAASTREGSLSGLPFQPPRGVWQKVNSESDHCLGLKCRFREKCFVLKARKEAAAAKILVVNHHLLFADISLRHAGLGYETAAVLPPYRKIVFDEAHNIEKSATSFFSRTLTRYSLVRQLNRLYSQKGSSETGVLAEMRKLAPEENRYTDLPAMIDKLKADFDVYSVRLAEVFMEEGTLHIEKGLPAFVFDILETVCVELQKQLLTLSDVLIDCCRSFNEEEREQPPVHDAQVIAGRLRGFAELFLAFRRWEDLPDRVFWIEKLKDRRGNVYVRFNETPVDVAPLLKSAVWDTMETIVFSSATMSIYGRFDYWKNRVGLDGYDERVRSACFPSPFPYRENVLMGIPSDSPDPSTPDFTWFFISFVQNLISLSEGKGLILFTSYSMLTNCYTELAPVFKEAGYRPLCQGDDDRSRLLEEFKRDVNSVLFATDSFWEGVDSPGETLQMLIISKLPFRVPNEPVTKARNAAILRRGGNPFQELALPEAVMKLKQGFGRLIRSSSDRGVIIIADNRLLTKQYGKFFIESLPETQKSFTESSMILKAVERFFY